VTCQGSVPQSIRAFLESTDFESAVRLAVSLGGDADTMGCMAGAIAHAFYKKIPKCLLVQTFDRMPHSYVDLALRFCHRYDVSY
jgi:ADP-ribosylglycohydrolase